MRQSPSTSGVFESVAREDVAGFEAGFEHRHDGGAGEKQDADGLIGRPIRLQVEDIAVAKPAVGPSGDLPAPRCS